MRLAYWFLALLIVSLIGCSDDPKPSPDTKKSERTEEKGSSSGTPSSPSASTPSSSEAEETVDAISALSAGTVFKRLKEMRLEWDEERNEFSIRQIRNPDVSNQKVSCKIVVKRDGFNAGVYVLSAGEWTLDKVQKKQRPTDNGYYTILYFLHNSQPSTATDANIIFCNHRPVDLAEVTTQDIINAFDSDKTGGIEVVPSE